MLTIGSLFSGIGGLELGLEMAGLGPTLWQVEREPFCRSVLAKHWPTAERFDDVRSVGCSNLAPVDLICGGFPCQDISYAGAGAGLAGARSGLWFEFARIVREVGPEFVVVENVSALLARGMGDVLGSLVSLGYDCWWDCIPASVVGAPHHRDRVFVVAHTNGPGLQKARAGVEPTRDFRHRWPKPGQPSASEIPRVGDGFPDWVDRVRALGNSVVPQCAEVVGGVIRELAGLTGEAA